MLSTRGFARTARDRICSNTVALFALIISGGFLLTFFFGSSSSQKYLEDAPLSVFSPEFQGSCDTDEGTSFSNIKNLHPLDERVLAHLRCYNLFPPTNLRINMDRPYQESSQHSNEIQRVIGNKMGGFFVECGANDGEYLSNTLGLEVLNNWHGLLIEAHPKFAKKLLLKNRNAWFANVCLSPNRTILDMEFLEGAETKSQHNPGVGKLQMEDDIQDDGYIFQPYGIVRCFPLASILAALKVQVVDFFSLDVQGIEFKILKTLPFDNSLKIKVILVEFHFDPEGKDEMRNWMSQRGYSVADETSQDFILIQDESSKSFSK